MAKAKKEPKEELTLWEKACKAEVLSEEIKDGCLHVTMRTYSGYTANLRIPIHTEEEEREIGARFAEAATRMCCPDLDLSQCKRIAVVH